FILYWSVSAAVCSRPATAPRTPPRWRPARPGNAPCCSPPADLPGPAPPRRPGPARCTRGAGHRSVKRACGSSASLR
ncbi:hypothetical protein PBMFNG_PBMFNG_15535, partial [Dysosmobacter welbionis]